MCPRLSIDALKFKRAPSQPILAGLDRHKTARLSAGFFVAVFCVEFNRNCTMWLNQPADFVINISNFKYLCGELRQTYEPLTGGIENRASCP